MKLKGKILSILLAVILCCTMLPVANAETVPQEEPTDFSLETVGAYGFISPVMLLRVSKHFDTDVTLTITYDTDKVMLGADQPEMEGELELIVTPDLYEGATVLAYFQFILGEGLTEDIPIYLEAKTADGTLLSTRNGLICPMDMDYSVSSTDTNDKIVPMFPLGSAIALQDNITLGDAKQLLVPAPGCSLEGYTPDGTPLADSDLLGTCCFLSSAKDGVIVSQAIFVTMGDLDGNGMANASDALMALQHSVQLIELDELQLAVADVDASESVNAADALTILQYSVGLIPYCVGGF